MSAPIEARFCGTVPYAQGLALQDETHRARRAGEIPDTLLHLEHPPVYTIGRRGSREQILFDDAQMRERGIEVHDADRGGQVTYHGPGQLVGYPILQLGIRADVVRYLRDLEEALIRTLDTYGIAARREPGHAGVWVGARKIASIGVRVTRGVTKHGYALNVDTDLEHFVGIVPCGVMGLPITSISQETQKAPSLDEVALRVESHLSGVLGREVVRPAREVSA